MTKKKRTESTEWKPYFERLKDPRWQKKRLEVMERDKFCCQNCYAKDESLNVHHWYYLPGADPWDYDDECLVTLCETCHGKIEVLRQRLMGCIGCSNWGNGFEEQMRHAIGMIQGTRLGAKSETVEIVTHNELEGLCLAFGHARDWLTDWIDAGDWSGISSDHSADCDDGDEMSWLITESGMSEMIEAMESEDRALEEVFKNRQRPISDYGFFDAGWWM